MLYKKYHRSYVKQFKKGTKIVYRGKNREMKFEVVREPFIYNCYYTSSIDASITKNGSRDLQVYLVYSSGRLSIENIEFIENVI